MREVQTHFRTATEVATTHVQDLVFSCLDPSEVPMGLLLELFQVPLNFILSPRCVTCPAQLRVMGQHAEGALNPTVCVVDGDIKKHRSQYGPLSL